MDTTKTPNNEPSAGQQTPSLLNRFLPLVLLAAVIYLQWPMLKGAYYKSVGSEVVAGEGPEWRTDLSLALAESEKTGKPILLDFSASWCPPCQVMKHDVWPNAKVRKAVTAGYIPVLLDIDIEANKPIAQHYGVDAIPTIIVTDPQGTVVRRSGYRSAANMLEFLSSQDS